METLEKMARDCEIYHADMLFNRFEWDAGLCKEAQTLACIAFNNLQNAQYQFQLAAIAQQRAEDKS